MKDRTEEGRRAVTHAPQTHTETPPEVRHDTCALSLVRRLAAMLDRDPDGFAAKSKRLEAAQADLDTAETEWLELELLREEIGG